MSRLDLAQNRFQAALEALENAAAGVGETLDGAAKPPERLAELEAERERFWPASPSWKTKSPACPA